MSFIKLVQGKKVAAPNSQKFSVDNWRETFKNLENPKLEDTSFYEAGILFYKIFEKIRENIYCLDAKIPECTNEEIITLHCAGSNINRIILSNQVRQLKPKTLNLNIPLNIKTNIGDVDIPPQDLADSAVDSIELALKKRLKNIKTKNNSNNPLEIMDFIEKDMMYSQIYYAFELYWQGLLWGSYTLEIDKDKYIIRQNYSSENINYRLSLNRKMKLELPDISTISYILSLGINFPTILLKDGKPVSGNTKDSTDINQAHFYQNMATVEKIKEFFPKSLMERKIGLNKFNILEILDIFTHLVFFSREVYDILYNDYKRISSKKEHYSPNFKLNHIIKILEQITGYNKNKIIGIINFLSFTPNKSNLWSYPIIKNSNNNITLLLSSFITPNLFRTVEYWLRDSLPKNIENKGHEYEKILVNKINNILKSRSDFFEFNLAKSKTIKINKKSEQIDCIFRFGKNIVICEAKCIVTVDSEISSHNTKKHLKKGAEQVKRKLNFIKDNIEESFKNLGWSYDCEKEYSLIPIVINSNKVFTGHIIDDVIISDDLILSRYFESEIIPLLSKDEENHLAWFIAYRNQKEAEHNFKKYLYNPPQLALNKNHIVYNISHIPTEIFDFKVEIHNLVIRQYDAEEILNAQYAFPLEKDQEIYSYIKKLDFLI